MPWVRRLVGDVACVPRSLLAFNKRCWWWWLLAVDEPCGRWSPWATVVTWHRWVGIVNDGGGWGRSLFGC